MDLELEIVPSWISFVMPITLLEVMGSLISLMPAWGCTVVSHNKLPDNVYTLTLTGAVDSVVNRMFRLRPEGVVLMISMLLFAVLLPFMLITSNCSDVPSKSV